MTLDELRDALQSHVVFTLPKYMDDPDILTRYGADGASAFAVADFGNPLWSVIFRGHDPGGRPLILCGDLLNGVRNPSGGATCWASVWPTASR